MAKILFVFSLWSVFRLLSRFQKVNKLQFGKAKTGENEVWMPWQYSLIRPLLWLTNAILFRSLRQDQIAGLQGQAYWQKEENHGQERQPQSLLQRVLRFHGWAKYYLHHCTTTIKGGCVIPANFFPYFVRNDLALSCPKLAYLTKIVLESAWTSR